MKSTGFRKFYWGFIFIMLSFRIGGFDILPDFVGYVLFAFGFSELSSKSNYFSTASKYNIVMIIVSIFSIYQKPVDGQNAAYGSLLFLSLLIGTVTFVFNLLIVYNLFMGIREMENQKGQSDLAIEADERWGQYKILQIASLCAFIAMFIPFINILYIIGLIIASIYVLIKILGFLKKCDEDILLTM